MSNHLNDSPDDDLFFILDEISRIDCDDIRTKCIAFEEVESESRRTHFTHLSSSVSSAELTSVTPLSNYLDHSLPQVTETVQSKCCDKQSNMTEYKLLDVTETHKRMTLLEEALENLVLREQCIKKDMHKHRTVPQRKKNMSFTNDQSREIDRVNEILLRKIMSHGKPRPKRVQDKKHTASAAINRHKAQIQIGRDNNLLLKKIDSIKSSRTRRN